MGMRQARWFKNQHKENERGGGSDRRSDITIRVSRGLEVEHTGEMAIQSR